MLTTLNDIFELEDNKQFDKAFEAYQTIYSKTNPDYQVWKHYYFLLWNLIEEATSEFTSQHNLQKLLQDTLQEGQLHFSDNADFNFIAGYTIGIFPYEYAEFGDYDKMEKIGREMILKATQLEPYNSIFKMCFLGFSENTNDNPAYEENVIDAASKILDTFSGKGCLNKYFKQVLYRTDKKVK